MRNRLLFSAITFLTILMGFQSCDSEHTLDFKRYYVNGKGLYEKNCQSCHGSNGEGLGKLYPPLTDTAYLKTHLNQFACIIKNGQNGMIRVNNVRFNEQMPGNKNLAEIDIAQIIVYVTNSFGNNMGHYDLTSVSQDLLNCK